MKILISPDKYKSALSSYEVSKVIEKGVKEVFPKSETLCVPMADGGDGSLETIIEANDGKYIYTEATDPLKKRIKTYYGILKNNKTAIIEVAKISGLHLVKPIHRNPLITTSFGVGELINHAVEHGVSEIIICLGGSATNDFGHGMLKALGFRFLDKNGHEIEHSSKNLKDVASIDNSNINPELKNIRFFGAYDVANKLLGQQGATYTYGPQKGGTKKMLDVLESGFVNLANLIKREQKIDVASMTGSGSAGGIGAALAGYLDGKLISGVELISKLTGIETKIKNVDLVITGEGKMDIQTFCGKTPYGVAKIARKHGKKVIAIVGTLDVPEELYFKHGFDAVMTTASSIIPVVEAIKFARSHILSATIRAMNLIKIGSSLPKK